MKKYNRITFKNTLKKGFASVIIPVYKDALGLEDTLKSLQKQKTNGFKYEIIVANDGGLKEEKKICKKYGVSCLSIKPRRGSYNARNTALENSRGEYLAFIDAGTIASKNWLYCGYKALLKYDYVGGPVEIIKDPRKKISDSFFLYQKATSFDIEKYFYKMKFFPTTNLFVKRRVIEVLGGFDRRLQSGGDGEFGERVFGSGQFTRRYLKDIKVFHYTRDFKSLVGRCKRISEGVVDLQGKYKNRFKSGGWKKYISSFLDFINGPLVLISKSVFSSTPITKKVQVIIIAYLFNIIDYFLYVKSKIYFSKKT